MALEPVNMPCLSQGDGQELGKMENRDLLSEITADLQIEMTHGAGSNNTVRPDIDGPLDDRVHLWSDDLRPGYGKEGTATLGKMPPRDRFCPQAPEDILHQPVEIGFMAHDRRSGQHASVIRGKS